jgi:hypothetical protein
MQRESLPIQSGAEIIRNNLQSIKRGFWGSSSPTPLVVEIPLCIFPMGGLVITYVLPYRLDMSLSLWMFPLSFNHAPVIISLIITDKSVATYLDNFPHGVNFCIDWKLENWKNACNFNEDLCFVLVKNYKDVYFICRNIYFLKCFVLNLIHDINTNAVHMPFAS